MMEKGDKHAKEWLEANEIENKHLWPFQIEAIEAIEKAIMDRRRHMLLAMATGTGKTRTIVNLIYRLMKSGLAKRILFLVDRRALAAQAVTEMASFEAEPGLKFDQIYEVYSQKIRREDLNEDMKFDPKVLPTEYLTNPSVRDSFVYVSTIQRMRINLFGDEGMFGSSSGDQDDDSGDGPERLVDGHGVSLLCLDVAVRQRGCWCPAGIIPHLRCERSFPARRSSGTCNRSGE